MVWTPRSAAKCGDTVWEDTAGGPHTAVIIVVTDKTLAVCHQHWSNVHDDICGYTFFRWFEDCQQEWSYHFDALKIYRPGPSSTGSAAQCDACRGVVDRIVEALECSNFKLLTGPVLRSPATRSLVLLMRGNFCNSTPLTPNMVVHQQFNCTTILPSVGSLNSSP